MIVTERRNSVGGWGAYKKAKKRRQNIRECKGEGIKPGNLATQKKERERKELVGGYRYCRQAHWKGLQDGSIDAGKLWLK